VQISDTHTTLNTIFRARFTVHHRRLCNGYVIATQRSTVNVTVNQTLVFDEKSAIGRQIVEIISDDDVFVKQGFWKVFITSVNVK
jgi:hypothetical protein